MGQRASDTRGITFEDVVVPKEVLFYSSLNNVKAVTQVIIIGNYIIRNDHYL